MSALQIQQQVKERLNELVCGCNRSLDNVEMFLKNLEQHNLEIASFDGVSIFLSTCQTLQIVSLALCLARAADAGFLLQAHLDGWRDSDLVCRNFCLILVYGKPAACSSAKRVCMGLGLWADVFCPVPFTVQRRHFFLTFWESRLPSFHVSTFATPKS